MAARIAILGIFVVDATFRTPRLPRMGETVIGESVALSPGGKGSNQAVAAARLGAEVRFISRIGRDSFADMGLAAWAEAGVEPLVARSDTAATGAAAVLVEAASGENAIVVCTGAAAEISEADVDAAADAIRSAAVFVTQFEQPLPAAARALAIAREAGVVTVLNPAPAADAPGDMLRLSDYVTPNEAEAEALTGLSVEDEEGARRAAAALRERGAGAAVITLGPRGALYDGPEGYGAGARLRCGAGGGDDRRGRRLQRRLRHRAGGGPGPGRGRPLRLRRRRHFRHAPGGRTPCRKRAEVEALLAGA